VSRVSNRAEGCGPPFIAPKRNLLVGVSEIQTCQSRGVGLVRKWLLEPGLGTGHVRCSDLTSVITCRSDMSGLGVTPDFKAKLNAHSMCAQESSLHTYHKENGIQNNQCLNIIYLLHK
jgi:hypothetical protein